MNQRKFSHTFRSLKISSLSDTLSNNDVSNKLMSNCLHRNNSSHSQSTPWKSSSESWRILSRKRKPKCGANINKILMHFPRETSVLTLQTPDRMAQSPQELWRWTDGERSVEMRYLREERRVEVQREGGGGVGRGIVVESVRHRHRHDRCSQPWKHSGSSGGLSCVLFLVDTWVMLSLDAINTRVRVGEPVWCLRDAREGILRNGQIEACWGFPCGRSSATTTTTSSASLYIWVLHRSYRLVYRIRIKHVLTISAVA